ncbi:uncharacterized protein VTP21DRAFT_9895 [Calcarisporiella thermophila]|uniref:uncharacterized protein n=1 Tax=Calcarisporiella thermophila TaxID=911321 RepID=UPI003743F42C
MTQDDDRPPPPKIYSLWVHDDRMSRQELIINPDHFPDVQEGQLLQIKQPNSDKPPLVLQLAAIDREFSAKQPQLRLSINSRVANLFGLTNRCDVLVQTVSPTSVEVDYVELTFRDAYLSRSDMWRLKDNLIGSCVFVGQKVNFWGCITVKVKELYIQDESVSCGYITSKTRAIFRSESSRSYLFIQMSREMWEFDEDGELLFEKTLYGFLPQLFEKWRELNMNHIITIIMFTRVFYEEEDVQNFQDLSALNRNEDGKWFKDFYKVIVDRETRLEWNNVILSLKEEFLQFSRHVLLREEGGRVVLKGNISKAYQGNVLECANLALNPFDKHYIDRDLLRTGMSVVIISPGTGKFHVSKKLLRLTTERMIDNGIPMDLICLSKFPLHSVPLFTFTSIQPPKDPEPSDASEQNQPRTSVSTGITPAKPPRPGEPMSPPAPLAQQWDPLYSDDSNNEKEKRPYFSVPHWIDCSYYSDFDKKFIKAEKFQTRCMMYEVQMMGIMEHEICPISIPWMDEERFKEDDMCDRYDDDIFTTSRSKKHPRLRTKSSGLRSLCSENQSNISEHLRGNHRSSNATSVAFHRRSQDDLVEADLSYKNTQTSLLSRSLPKKITLPVTNTEREVEYTQAYNGLEDRAGIGESTERFKAWNSSTDNHNKQPLVGSLGDPHSSGFEDRIHRARANEQRDAVDEDADIEQWAMDGETGGESRNSNADDETWASPVRSLTKAQPIAIRPTQPSRRYNREHTTPVIGSMAESSFHSFSAEKSRRMTRQSPARIFMSRQLAKQTFVNPCNPSKNPPLMTQDIARWRHVYPRMVSTMELQRRIDWTSLCMPACLPLTTEYFPTQEELSTQFREYTYTISPSDEGTIYTDYMSHQRKIEYLLKELVGQRLSQGFQLIVPGANPVPLQRTYTGSIPTDNKERTSVQNNNQSNNKKLSELNRTTMRSEQNDALTTFSVSKPFYLSLGQHVHMLYYDTVSQNLEFKRYVRRISYSTDPIDYSYAVWPKDYTSYTTRDARFHYPELKTYNWNYLDHFVCGYQDEMISSLRYWRIRFLVIPMETLPVLNHPANEYLDEEEIRVESFRRMLDLFRKAKFVPPQEEKERRRKQKETNLNLGVSFTTMRSAAHVAKELGKDFQDRESRLSISSNPERLNQDTKLERIAQAMQSSTGVKIQDRWWHLRLFEAVFIGTEFVDWLIREFTDIDTREEAIFFGNQLMERGLFVHARGHHTFLDGHYFYQLKPEYMQLPKTGTTGPLSSAGKASWFRPGSNHQSKPDSPAGTFPTPSPSTDANINETSPPDQPSTFQMSRAMLIDVDTHHKSDRSETVKLHYDTLINVRQCYHFHLAWIGVTSRLIEELLQSWTRTLDKCGLRLVEAPFEQIPEVSDPKSSNDPFGLPLPIRFAVPPPSVEEVTSCCEGRNVVLPPNYFEGELAKSLEFVLDVEADANFPSDVQIEYSYHHPKFEYTQYVHSSGIAFLQILPEDRGGGFLWAVNRLYASHNNISTSTRGANIPTAASVVTGTSVGSGIGGTREWGASVGNTPSNSTSTAGSTSASGWQLDAIRMRVQEICADEKRLGAFWAKCLDRLANLPTPALDMGDLAFADF